MRCINMSTLQVATHTNVTIPITQRQRESRGTSIRLHNKHVAAPRTVLYTSLIAQLEIHECVSSNGGTHQKEHAFFLRKFAEKSGVIII